MEFQEYIRKKNELTKNCTLGSCNADCRLDKAAHSHNLEYCDVFESSYPEEAEKVIKDWYDETHSTNAEVITNLFPNVNLNMIRPCEMDISIQCQDDVHCDDCRNEWLLQEYTKEGDSNV